MFRNIDELAQLDGTRPGRAELAAGPLRADGRLALQGKASRPSLDELAFRIAVAFRQHGHIGNVLTHICGRDWAKLEQSLRCILDPGTVGPELSPLAHNIVELLCANRGVTGPIARFHFHRTLDAIFGPTAAARLAQQVERIFVRIGRAPRRSVAAVPAVEASQRQARR